MNYVKPEKFIDINTFDEVVSFGNKCPSTIILREFGIYKKSFPFDYIPSSPKLILKYLINNEDYFPKKNIITTNDGVWFGHFNLDNEYEKTIETLKRRFERLINLFKEKKRILFCYTSEADLYNENGNRYNDNYNDLKKITQYIIDTYNYDNFIILAIHNNKIYEDTKNIINYTINVEDKYLSDNMETHTPEICGIYRNILKNLLNEILHL